MKTDKNELYRQLIDDINMGQQKMAEYNKKNHLPIIRKDSRTIKEEENIIINKYGGKKLNTEYFYEHLTDFFGAKNSFDYLRMISPCKIIFNYTEEVVPDEYFYSFYWLPFKEGKMRRNEYYKELLVYITSTDGNHVYTAGPMTGVVDSSDIASIDFDEELRRDMAYYAEGIVIYFEDIENEK